MVLKNLFTGQQWRNRHGEYTYGHGERGGEGEMYGKSNVETYIQFSSVQFSHSFVSNSLSEKKTTQSKSGKRTETDISP